MPKNPPQEAASSPRGPTLGGMPPGLSLPSPREADIIELAPKEALVTQTQRYREKEPMPRISDTEYRNVGRALDVWARIENPEGNPDITDDIFLRRRTNEIRKAGSDILIRSAPNPQLHLRQPSQSGSMATKGLLRGSPRWIHAGR